MNHDELKIILEMVNGIKDGAVNITVVYLLLTSLVPLLKTGFIGIVIMYGINKIVSLGRDL